MWRDNIAHCSSLRSKCKIPESEAPWIYAYREADEKLTEGHET